MILNINDVLVMLEDVIIIMDYKNKVTSSIINAGVKNFLTRGVNIKKKYFQESIKVIKNYLKK